MKKTHATILILALLLATTACVKLGGKPLDKKFYRIHPVRSGQARTRRTM